MQCLRKRVPCSTSCVCDVNSVIRLVCAFTSGPFSPRTPSQVLLVTIEHVFCDESISGHPQQQYKFQKRNITSNHRANLSFMARRGRAQSPATHIEESVRVTNARCREKIAQRESLFREAELLRNGLLVHSDGAGVPHIADNRRFCAAVNETLSGNCRDVHVSSLSLYSFHCHVHLTSPLVSRPLLLPTPPSFSLRVVTPRNGHHTTTFDLKHVRACTCKFHFPATWKPLTCECLHHNVQRA